MLMLALMSSPHQMKAQGTKHFKITKTLTTFEGKKMKKKKITFLIFWDGRPAYKGLISLIFLSVVVLFWVRGYVLLCLFWASNGAISRLFVYIYPTKRAIGIRE